MMPTGVVRPQRRVLPKVRNGRGAIPGAGQRHSQVETRLRMIFLQRQSLLERTTSLIDCIQAQVVPAKIAPKVGRIHFKRNGLARIFNGLSRVTLLEDRDRQQVPGVGIAGGPCQNLPENIGSSIRLALVE